MVLLSTYCWRKVTVSLHTSQAVCFGRESFGLGTGNFSRDSVELQTPICLQIRLFSWKHGDWGLEYQSMNHEESEYGWFGMEVWLTNSLFKRAQMVSKLSSTIEVHCRKKATLIHFRERERGERHTHRENIQSPLTWDLIVLGRILHSCSTAAFTSF